MKRYLSDFKLTEKFVEESILECLSHTTGKVARWKRKDTAYFLADYLIRFHFTESTNIHEVANHVYKKITENIDFYRKHLIPCIAQDLLKEIEEENIQLNPIFYQKRVDNSSGKVRDIGITSIKQQVLDYVCVNAIKPMFNAKIGYYQCSSIKGRGQKHAKKAIEKFIRQKHKKARFAIKSDIQKYYNSIQHRILFEFLERDIKNKNVLYLVKTLVATYSDNGIGLCIGTYLSQYLANYYLSYAYHYITEMVTIKRKERKTGNVKQVHPFKRVVYYMDDMIFLGSNKKCMKRGMQIFIEYLDKHLGLKLKYNTYMMIDLFQEKSFIDVVGYRFYKDHTTVRKRIFNRIVKGINTIKKFKHNTSIKICKGFMSRHGYIKQSDSVKFMKRHKYNQVYQIAKEVIRNEAKSSVYREAAVC